MRDQKIKPAVSIFLLGVFTIPPTAAPPTYSNVAFQSNAYLLEPKALWASLHSITEYTNKNPNTKNGMGTTLTKTTKCSRVSLTFVCNTLLSNCVRRLSKSLLLQPRVTSSCLNIKYSMVKLPQCMVAAAHLLASGCCEMIYC